MTLESVREFLAEYWSTLKHGWKEFGTGGVLLVLVTFPLLWPGIKRMNETLKRHAQRSD